MARPLSRDLRQRIVEAVEAGASRNAVAKRFDVSASTVIKLMQRFEATGSIEPGQMGGWKDYALSPHQELVRNLIAARPDMTLEELARLWPRRAYGLGAPRSIGFSKRAS